jgi:uncharacterized protein (DUF58 family)
MRLKRHKEFEYKDILSALTNIRGGVPIQRLSTRVRLGEHRSVFFGPSYDFYDIQEFDPERDPPNQIIPSFFGPDEDIIYSRKCIEPHEVKINFLIDLSSSIYAGAYHFKRRMLLESIGYIGITGIRYQDPVGLVGFTDKVVLNIQPKCGSNNFYHLLKVVYDFLDEHDPSNRKEEKRQTDYFTAFDFIRRSFIRSSFIPVISDFVGFKQVASSPLLRTVAAKHELVFIFLDDPLEYISGKGVGYLRMRDIEGGKEAIVSRKKLKGIEQETRQRRRQLRQELRRMGIDSVVLEYGKHFNRLQRFFMARHKSLSRLSKRG